MSSVNVPVHAWTGCRAAFTGSLALNLQSASYVMLLVDVQLVSGNPGRHDYPEQEFTVPHQFTLTL